MRRALWVGVEKYLVLIGAAVDFASQRNSSGAKKPDMEGAVEKTAKVKGDTYYGKVAQNYETRRRKQSWWGVEQDEMQSLLTNLPEGLSVLDVPFGTGRFVPFYKKRGYKVTGLDASHEMIEQAKELLGEAFDGVETNTGSAMDLPFKDGSFDLMVSTRFLRDIITYRDARAALMEFGRVTRRYAIIQLGNSIDGTSAVVADDEPMGSRLSAAAVDDLLAVSGFRVLDRRRVKHDPDENSEIHHVLCEKV